MHTLTRLIQLEINPFLSDLSSGRLCLRINRCLEHKFAFLQQNNKCGLNMEKQFGKEYILIHQLGKGGMAEVYLAIKKPRKDQASSNTSKLLALKTMISSFSSSAEFVKMFEEETDIVMNMSHKNIASVIGHNTVKEFAKGKMHQKLVLELEFIRGKNLRQFLKDLYTNDTDLLFEEKIYIIKELAAGLDYTHRFVHPKTGEKLHLTHSDISPQNTMISIEGEIKLIDFGISKRNDPFQKSNMRAKKLQGKFSYMSPEQADGLEIDQKTDIFSLGIILWELLAKQRLFYANNQVKILKKVKETYIPPLKQINPNIPHVEAVEKITQKVLIRDRNLRKVSAKDLHQELSSLLNAKYPNFNPTQLGYKIQNLYKEEFDKLNKIIKNSLEQLEKKGIEFDEKTKTLTLIEEESARQTKLVDIETASEASKLISFNELKSKDLKQKQKKHLHSIRNQHELLKAKKKKQIEVFTPLQIAGLSGIFLIIISVLYFKAKYPEQTLQAVEGAKIAFQKIKKQVVNDNKATLTSKTKTHINLFISSHPSKAQIFIDGMHDLKKTPRQINFNENQTIVLKSEGYKDYILTKEDIKKALTENNQIFVILRKE